MDIKRFTPSRIRNSILRRWYKRTKNYKGLAGLLYKQTFGKSINWKEPKDLNQWINWLAFNTDTSDWSLLADKYRMRDYISERGYSDNLVPLLAVWEKVEDIDFSNLPKGFVIKVNNGSGDVKIVHDKNQVNVEEIKEYFSSILRHPFGIDTAEPHYLRIKPYIIVEKLLDVTKQSSKSTSLIDYKIWSFNGKPTLCLVCSNRTKDHYSTDIFTADLKWQKKDDFAVHDTHHLHDEKAISAPHHLDEMLKIASDLSKGHAQMRVDFYEVDGRVYVGELTMTAACGRMTGYSPECLKLLGSECKKAYEALNHNCNR